MDSTTRPNPSRLPNISQLTVSKQCKKNTGSLHLCSLSPSPDCEPQLYEPLDSLWKGDMVLEARAYCPLFSANLRTKAIFLFPPNCLLFVYSAPDGQRKTRFWWQHYHQQRLQQDTNNYSHFTSKSHLRYRNWEELILSLYWICFCDFLILPLLLL